MSEVTDGDSARDGSANAGGAEHPLRSRARREKRHFEEVKEAFKRRLASLTEQHDAWAATQLDLITQLETEAYEAEERLRRDEAENGAPQGDAEVVRNRPDQGNYRNNLAP